MKCKCITCTHIAEITKLIPDDILRNKVLAVTDDLYEAMAGENIDLEMKTSDLKINLDIACNGLKDKDKKIKELEQINELLREQNIALIKANTKVEKQNEVLRDKMDELDMEARAKDMENAKLQDEIDKLKNPRCDCKTQKWIEEQYED